MEINEAKQILNKAGFYLCEFRDSSNPLDKETEESNWRNSSDEVSWNNVKARDRSNISGEDTTKEDNAVAKMTNSLISKVDEVCNRFEDYDYFVKRYNSYTIQVRTTEKKDTGVPFIQITVYYEKNGEFKFCCGLGRVDQELRRKTYKDYTEVEDVLKWVSTCLGNGYINESMTMTEGMTRFEYNDKFAQVVRMYAEANDIDDEDQVYDELMDNDELPEWIDSDLTVYEIVYDKLMN